MSARAIAIHGYEMSGEWRANLEIKSECPALLTSKYWGRNKSHSTVFLKRSHYISAKSAPRAGRGSWVTRADPSPVMTQLSAVCHTGRSTHPPPPGTFTEPPGTPSELQAQPQHSWHTLSTPGTPSAPLAHHMHFWHFFQQYWHPPCTTGTSPTPLTHLQHP